MISFSSAGSTDNGASENDQRIDNAPISCWKTRKLHRVRKKRCHSAVASNFARCWPIFKILSSADLALTQTRRYTTLWNVCSQKSACPWAEWSELGLSTPSRKNSHTMTLASFCSVTKTYFLWSHRKGHWWRQSSSHKWLKLHQFDINHRVKVNKEYYINHNEMMLQQFLPAIRQILSKFFIF